MGMRTGVFVGAAVAAALLLSGCGAEAEPAVVADPAVVQVLQRAAEVARTSDGVAFTLTATPGAAETAADGAKNQLTTGRGAVRAVPSPLMKMVLESPPEKPDAAPQVVEERIVNGVLYGKGAFEPLPGEGSWTKVNLAIPAGTVGFGAGLMELGGPHPDPLADVRALGASTDVRLVGTETVDGVAARHFSGTLPSDVPDSDEPTAFEAWVDEAFHVLRVEMTYPGGAVSKTTFTDFGKAFEVYAPPAEDVLDLDAEEY